MNGRDGAEIARYRPGGNENPTVMRSEWRELVAGTSEDRVDLREACLTPHLRMALAHHHRVVHEGRIYVCSNPQYAADGTEYKPEHRDLPSKRTYVGRLSAARRVSIRTCRKEKIKFVYPSVIDLRIHELTPAILVNTRIHPSFRW